MTPVPGFSGSLGGLLARAMHDEDSHYGRNVQNAAGESWTAYGDKRLFDDVSKANRAMAIKASQASADDVWDAYEGKPTAYSALQFTPDLVKVADVTSKKNFSPLFKVVDGVAARRNDVGDRQDYSWTKDWWGWSTYALIYATHDYQHVRVYDLASSKPIGWLGSASNYTAIVTDEKDAHGCYWSFEGEDLYLRKQTAGTAGNDRYLGVSDYGKAGWGLWGGWRDPVVYNQDLSISLKNDAKRKLCADGDRAHWSDGSSNSTIVRIDLPLTGPSSTS